MFLQGICRWSGYAGADASTYIPWTFLQGQLTAERDSATREELKRQLRNIASQLRDLAK
jgi:hypothetical protein